MTTRHNAMIDVSVDTNILAYAEGLGDPIRVAASRESLLRIAGRMVLCTQVLGELYNVLVRKAGRPTEDALAALDLWRADCRLVGISDVVFWNAAGLAAANRLQIWDAVILAASEAAGCAVMLSEDMQHGFRWRRITIVNPFVQPPHPLIAGVGGS